MTKQELREWFEERLSELPDDEGEIDAASITFRIDSNEEQDVYYTVLKGMWDAQQTREAAGGIIRYHHIEAQKQIMRDHFNSRSN